MKRFLSFLLAAVMASSLLVLPAGAAEVVRFSDVTDQNTIMAVESLRLMGVLDGYNDNTFRPGAALNRAQFCKMAVYAMNGEEELGLYNTVTIFPDAKPSHWASAYINMASRKGIIAGYPDGKFHPERSVTVGQAVIFAGRVRGLCLDGDAEAALEENKLLKEHLGLRPSQREFEEELVSITAWSSSNWESAFTISKGSSLGVEAGDCVVDEYWNLVGVVSQVGENWATVSTVINTDTEIGGIVTRTYSAGVLEGDFALMNEGKLKLNYLPEEAQLVSGDEVLTSGRGEIFPSGADRGRKRTTRKVMNLLLEYLEESSLGIKAYSLAVGYGYDIEEGLAFRDQALSLLQDKGYEIKEIPVYQIGATIGVHTGPYPLGFGIIEKALPV